MELNKGLVFAAAAYMLWGFLPIFWKSLESVSPLEIMGHRMVWSMVFLALVLSYRRQWRRLSIVARTGTALIPYLGTACLLGINWFTYLWAVNHGYIVETSLGYFINPLINVLLGVIFLGENVRIWQWVSILVAASGVGWLTFSYGALPWIALTLAFSFGFYGLLRKIAALDALEGLSLEMAILFLPALVYLFFLESSGLQSFGHTGPVITILLVLAGVVTAVPLLLFAAGARRIKLITLGILQYMAPTLQLLLGVFVYGEPFSQARMIGFGLIWLALLLYSLEGIRTTRQNAARLAQGAKV
jgi:chloramphenicol-sensitive protein RarD